jgi:DNA-binding MarR family transcriptional regulator
LTGTEYGNVGAHVRVLEDAGYVTTTKAFAERRPRTTVQATRAGRHAFESYLAHLERVISAARTTPASRS